MAEVATPRPQDSVLIRTILKHVVSDLAKMLGHKLTSKDERTERATERPVGPDQVHISFKLGLRGDDGIARHGTLLVPLPDSITMACLLLMTPAETVNARREEEELDDTLKDAMLEIGNMVGGATNTALLELGLEGWAARSEGCQGVRANVRPAFPYDSGTELVVGRTVMKLASFPPFGVILVIPALH